MEVHYLEHALDQMAEGRITDVEVRAVLARPLAVARATYGAVPRTMGVVDRRRIRVVVEDGTDPVVVVSVMLRRSIA